MNLWIRFETMFSQAFTFNPNPKLKPQIPQIPQTKPKFRNL